MNFTPIDRNGLVEGYCIIKTIDKKTSARGDTYLDMTLGDKDGEINAKLWSYNEMLHGTYNANDIVKIRGTISPYNGINQLKVDRIRIANEQDGVSPDDFVPTADYTGRQMFDELLSIADGFADQDLRKLVLTIYKGCERDLLYWPAAFKLHHAIRGGLLMHTLSIVRLAQGICKIYPFVDSDLLIAGAMLHDISKLDEFEVSDSGIVSGYSVRGNLLGHLAEGAMFIRKTAEELGINPEISMLIEHMILSHHGEPEFGAAVRPMFLEAELLSQLDLLDSRVYEITDALNATEPGDFSGKLWALDNRKIYNHARNTNDKKVNLF